MLTWCDRNYPKLNSDSNKRLQIWHCNLVWCFWLILNSYCKLLMLWPLSACIVYNNNFSYSKIFIKNLKRLESSFSWIHQSCQFCQYPEIHENFFSTFLWISLDEHFLCLHCSKHLKIQFRLHLVKTSLIRLTKTLWNGTFTCTYF